VNTTVQIVVCAPVFDVGGVKFDPAGAPYSTYSKVECPHCRKQMWLGERSRLLIERGQAQMMCMVCAVTTGVMDPGCTMERLTDRDA
jgi:hypothetical protein